MNPIPEDKLRAAVDYCMQSARLSELWASAPDSARPYILLRFYAAAFTSEITPEEYEARREEASASLGPDDIRFLLQNEKEIEEVKFLISLRNRREKQNRQEARPPQPAPRKKRRIVKVSASRSAGAIAKSATAKANGPRALMLFFVIALACGAAFFFMRSSQSPAREDADAPNEMRPFASDPSQGPSRHTQPSDSPPASAQQSPDSSARDAENGLDSSAEQSGHAEEKADVTSIPQPGSNPRQFTLRSQGNTLNALGGIKFGEPLPSVSSPLVPVAHELLGEGSSIAACGVGHAVNGPVLKKKFLSFGALPVVWLTPKTRRVYKIEFKWEGTQKPDVAVADAMAALESRFSVKSEALPGGAGRAIRLGETVIRVDPLDGPAKMRVEHLGVKKEGRLEFEEVRRGMMEDFDASRLFAAGYPGGGMAPSVKGRSAKNETPRSFCGVAFGSLPVPGTHVVTDSRTGVRSFFLDYGGRTAMMFKCFIRGRADFTSARGVYAVELYSPASPDELTFAEYRANVLGTLARRLQPDAVDAVLKKGLPARFTAGDVEIVLSDDPQGGLLLRAALVNLPRSLN